MENRPRLEEPACRGLSTALFFPDLLTVALDEISSTLAICGACPIKQECLRGALARGEPAGIWGGICIDLNSWDFGQARAARTSGDGPMFAEALARAAESTRRFAAGEPAAEWPWTEAYSCSRCGTEVEAGNVYRGVRKPAPGDRAGTAAGPHRPVVPARPRRPAPAARSRLVPRRRIG